MVGTRYSGLQPACLKRFIIACALLLGACGGGGGSSIPTGSVAADLKLTGTVHGGQNPVADTQVIAIQAGSSGYGKGDRGLACTTTNTNGQFSFGSGAPICPGFPGLSTSLLCPSTGSQEIYLFALGGNPGSGVDNPALTMIAPLGSCNSLPPGFTVTINEVTTAATVLALSQFMNCASGAVNGTAAGCGPGSRDIGTSATNPLGLINAVAVAGNLANFSTGAAQSVLGGGGIAPPTSEINTLGDIVQDCVNSTGASSTACHDLFSCVVPGAEPGAGNNAPCTIPTGGLMPSDTLTATLDIVRSPANNVVALFNLVSKTPAFTPALSSAPHDWTAAVVLSGTIIQGGSDIAIDAQGNAWVPAELTMVEIGPNGDFISGGSGYPYAADSVAIDVQGDAWSTDYITNSVTAFNPFQGSISGTFPGANRPLGLAIDGADNVWIANTGANGLFEINAKDEAASPSGGFTGGGLNGPFRIAIDVAGNAWAINSGASGLSEFSAGGNPLSGTNGYTGGGLNRPTDIAIDINGNVWTTNSPSNTTGDLAEFSSGGIAISPATGFTGGLQHPDGIAIDGADNVWVTNSLGNSVVEFTQAGTPISGPAGYRPNSSGIDEPFYLAIDAAGNLWVINGDDLDDIIEIIGLATPVLTPKAACLARHNGHAVCLP
jgi:streptogramin lyase